MLGGKEDTTTETTKQFPKRRIGTMSPEDGRAWDDPTKNGERDHESDTGVGKLLARLEKRGSKPSSF